VEIYPKLNGKLEKFYHVDEIYIPKEFKSLHLLQSKEAIYYDYALVKIKG